MAQQSLGAPYVVGYATQSGTIAFSNAISVVAVINNNSVAQTATIAGFDGAQQVFSEPALSGGQIVSFPSPGIPLTQNQGLSITVTGTPSGGGFQICYRTSNG